MAEAVHREAQGNVVAEIVEVKEGSLPAGSMKSVVGLGWPRSGPFSLAPIYLSDTRRTGATRSLPPFVSRHKRLKYVLQ